MIPQLYRKEGNENVQDHRKIYF